MRKALFIIIASLFLYAILYWFFWDATDVSILKKQYPVVLYKGKGNTEVHFSKARPTQWVTLAEISPIAMRAIIISEDSAFYSHHGYDLDQIWESFKENIRKKRFARGGSTITQQVTKNVFLDADKTLWRKFRELILALRMERQVGKRRILETYFNIAEWGEGIYGIRAAALYYFQKTPNELTAKEGAFLAMLLPSPIKYSISFRKSELSRYARATTNTILKKMFQVHALSEEEFKVALDAPYSFEKQATPSFEPSVENQEILDEDAELDAI